MLLPTIPEPMITHRAWLGRPRSAESEVSLAVMSLAGVVGEAVTINPSSLRCGGAADPVSAEVVPPGDSAFDVAYNATESRMAERHPSMVVRCRVVK